ncbi:MAG TPA: cytochrome c peroxidase [Phycisphaerales bacterium]|nr:cytochrome c peroxidase [Phycisphaerales bacterium]
MDRRPVHQPSNRAARLSAHSRTCSYAAALCCALASLFVTTSAHAALPPVPVPAENPMTENKRLLGKILFWDEQLSMSNVVSCATCHTPSRGGADDRIANHPGADGVFGTPDDVRGSAGNIRSSADLDFVNDVTFALQPQVTNRAANPVINAAFAPLLFWDGRASSQFFDPQNGNLVIVNGGALESQSVNPPVSSVEMGHDNSNWTEIVAKLRRVRPLALATNHPSDVASALASRPTYPDLFQLAFGSREITASRVAQAIATYQRTLISDQTPFDAFRAGDTAALTPQEVRGFNAFQGSGCAACHNVNNDLFTDFTFRNIGLRPNNEDLGRQIVTGNTADRGKFKVPGLRNVGLKRTFMHNGQFTTLAQVIGFYAGARAVQPPPDNRDPAMNNVVIPPPPPGAPPGTGAGADIAAFLANALTDPRVAAQTFPFDHPTLFVDRPADRATILPNTAQPGTGGVAPAMIAQAPAMIGNLEYRLGVGTPGALVGAQAYLAVSSNPPVGGRVTPDELFGPVTITGSTNGGAATWHWPIRSRDKVNNQIVFAQWLIPDAGSPTGEARSAAAQIRFFCGSSGCPTPCPADFDENDVQNAADLFAFLDAWFAQFQSSGVNLPADFNGSGTVEVGDLFEFLDAWFQPCSI